MDFSGSIHAEGSIHTARSDLDRWMKTLPQPLAAAMEATVFTGWIYDHLKPHAAALKVAHTLMLRAVWFRPAICGNGSAHAAFEATEQASAVYVE